MSDLLLVALVIGFFALAALYVRGCERLVGRPEPGRADPTQAEPGPQADAAVKTP